jgi:hypothetical protein
VIAGGTGPECAFASESDAFAFPEVGGWKQPKEAQRFSPDDLYEYIDGAADLYLSYDFQELRVTEYQNEKKATVTVEVYRHKTPQDAFGMYSQERLPTEDFRAIGAQGYVGKDFLNFVAGPYYVKISGFKIEPEGQEVLTSVAKGVAESLGGKGGLPSVLKIFPTEGKIDNSEKYISRKFLGYAFLHSVFTADYDLSGKRFKIFVMECGDRDGCRSMLHRYFQEVGRSVNDVPEGLCTVADPHHGEVALQWKDTWIWGVLNLDDPALRSKHLKLVEERLAGMRR